MSKRTVKPPSRRMVAGIPQDYALAGIFIPDKQVDESKLQFDLELLKAPPEPPVVFSGVYTPQYNIFAFVLNDIELGQIESAVLRINDHSDPHAPLILEERQINGADFALYAQQQASLVVDLSSLEKLKGRVRILQGTSPLNGFSAGFSMTAEYQRVNPADPAGYLTESRVAILGADERFVVEVVGRTKLNPDNPWVRLILRDRSGNLVGEQLVTITDDFDFSTEIDMSFVLPETREFVSNPADKRPPRFRGRIVDQNGQNLLLNTQLIVFDAPVSGDRIPVLVTNTNGNGDWSVPYPLHDFSTADSALAVLGGVEVTELKIKLVETKNYQYDADGNLLKDPGGNPLFTLLYRLPEFTYLIVSLEQDDSDCGCADKADCHCHTKTRPRLAEHGDLIGNSDFGQDLGGGCVNFTTPNRTLEEFNFQSIVRTTEPDVISVDVQNLPAGLTDNTNIPDFAKRRELNDKSLADWDVTPVISQAVTIAHGHILNYRQRYYSDGYSLGDLLYSLPLAPGQKKNIAVFDWDRQETASRNEAQVVSEELESLLSRDRDISQVVRGTIRENMRGGSSASVSGRSGGGGLAVIGSFFGFGGGFSASSSKASSSAFQNSAREASSNMNNRLRDTTLQSASALRSQRATVVTAVSQGETLSVTTESVANYNHCHAITIQYFEVLRHIAIKQELVEVQECLFVPLLMTRFDELKTLRWRDHLEQNLNATGPRRAQLLRGFEAVQRRITSGGYDNFPVQSYAEEPVQSYSGQIVLQITIKRPAEQVTEEKEALKQQLLDRFGFLAWLMPNFDKAVERMVNKSVQEKEIIFQAEMAPLIARELVQRLQFMTNEGINLNLDCSLLSRYQKGGLHQISIRPSSSTPTNVPRVNINTMQIVTYPAITEADYFALVERGFLSYATEHFSGHLFNSSNIRNDLTNADGVVISTRPGAEELRNPKKEDAELSVQLVQHLNEHLEFYHHAIWYHMSPARRFALLEGIKMPNNSSLPKSVRGKSVASIIQNELVAIVGNSLILPVSPGFNADPVFYIPRPGLDPDPDETRISINGYTLLEHYAPLTPVDPFRISLPTKGVFAEAVQGSCNSCEKIDDTRYWRWEESPIPDSPTPIESISTDTRRAEPQPTTPTTLPNPIVNIQNAPPAPDPVGLDAFFSLLGQKGLFEDITGLAGNQNNALQGLIQANNGAQAFAKMATQLATIGYSNKNADKIREQINAAVDTGRISSEEGSKLTKQLFETQIGQPILQSGASGLVDSPEVKQSIRAFNESEKGSLALSSSEGSVTVTKDVAEGRITNGDNGGIVQKVTYFVPTINQAGENDCWAAALTMLYSWKSGQSVDFITTLQGAGEPYIGKFLRDEPLYVVEKAWLLDKMGLVGEPPMNYSLAGLTHLLKNHGPIWLTLDTDASDAFSAHAIVVYAIEGTGNPNTTVVHFIDPDPQQGQGSMTFAALMKQYEALAPLGFTQVVHYPDIVRPDLQWTPSGATWVQQFPGSLSVDDLSENYPSGTTTINFRQNVRDFLNALESAGIKPGTSGNYYKINSTFRPKERAYMMHWSWKIVKKDLDPQLIPHFPGVDIQWWHGNLPDSVAGAKTMADGFGIAQLNTPPALESHHTRGLAIDLNIHWSGPLKIKRKDGTELTISSVPRDNTNPELIEVAKTYGVIHFKHGVSKDKVHFSVDGN